MKKEDEKTNKQKKTEKTKIPLNKTRTKNRAEAP